MISNKYYSGRVRNLKMCGKAIVTNTHVIYMYIIFHKAQSYKT